MGLLLLAFSSFFASVEAYPLENEAMLLLDDGAGGLVAVEQGSLVPKVRRKRFLNSIGNLLAIQLFPLPIFPTNFIGLQVTVKPPNNRRRG